MSNEEFERECKKFGIKVKDGKIEHPLFGNCYDDLKKQLEEYYKSQEAPLFQLLREQEPDKVENPKCEWAINERTNIIDDWILLGLNFDNNEVWFNRKTKKIFEGSLN